MAAAITHLYIYFSVSPAKLREQDGTHLCIPKPYHTAQHTAVQLSVCLLNPLISLPSAEYWASI